MTSLKVIAQSILKIKKEKKKLNGLLFDTLKIYLLLVNEISA